VILRRYFLKEVLSNTLAVSLVLLLVMLSTRFVKYLAAAAAGNLDTRVVLVLVLYRIPDFLQLILPLGLFVALLLVYARLYLDNEMRVLHAAGISRLRILGWMQVPVLLVTLVVAGISLWLAPQTLERVETIYQQQDSRSEIDSLQAGRFQPFRDRSGVIYTESIQHAEPEAEQSGQSSASTRFSHNAAQTQMENVYLFQQELSAEDGSAEQGNVVVVAKKGSEGLDEHGRYLILEQGYRINEHRLEKRFEKIEFARYGQKIEVNRQADALNLETDAQPTLTLQSSSRRDYQVAWQWRLSIILLTPVVALIAVALGKVDPRQGRYLKILPAILLYLVYLVMLNVVRNQLLSGKLPLSWGLWWVHGLFLLVGCGLFNLESGWFTRWFTRDARPTPAVQAGDQV
jgi:lipopolysaccharide export system permease protein